MAGGRMSQFAFLQREWSAVCDAATRAEASVHADPRTACFYARRTLELAVSWSYKFDPTLKLPYQDNLSALLHELAAVRELFHVCYWLARTYGRADRPAPPLAFDAASLPKSALAVAQTTEQMQRLAARSRSASRGSRGRPTMPSSWPRHDRSCASTWTTLPSTSCG
jgi:type I restriction enzyme R subunit